MTATNTNTNMETKTKKQTIDRGLHGSAGQHKQAEQGADETVVDERCEAEMNSAKIKSVHCGFVLLHRASNETGSKVRNSVDGGLRFSAPRHGKPAFNELERDPARSTEFPLNVSQPVGRHRSQPGTTDSWTRL